VNLGSELAAIVTGGASGLGAATARMLAGQGVKVTLFDLNAEAGEQIAREIAGRFSAVDVTDDASVTEAVAEAEAAHGVTRVLVNCAGIAPAIKTVGRDATPHPLDTFRKTVEINLIGTFNVISKVAARLSQADPIGEERGVIISTASVAAYDGQIGQAAYAASKGGVVAMTLAIARDLSQHRIRVMTIAPGIFWTPMLAGLPQAAQDSLGTQVPHPSRLGRPEEYAQLVEAIIANPMLNGEVIRLDGAIRMAPR
jgi:NAD(P)-dependent dehydrogenase (short-subunit alcohol dehydrogenase family)